MLGKFASTDVTEHSESDRAAHALDLPDDSAGVIHAVIHAKIDLGLNGTLFRLALPLSTPQPPIGQFLLARPCTDDRLTRRSAWSLYARRPLFVADILPQTADGISLWNLVLPSGQPTGEDAGDRWLRAQVSGTRLNMTGPYGQPLAFTPQQRTLLVVTDPRHLLLCLPAIHHCLDLGGRATLILQTETVSPPAMLQRIPIPVEVHTAVNLDTVQEHLNSTLRWADSLLVALPELSTTWLSHAIRMARFRLEPSYAHIYMHADYLCGYGACLACAVPAGDGYTRACQHGPFLPLDAIGA